MTCFRKSLLKAGCKRQYMSRDNVVMQDKNLPIRTDTCGNFRNINGIVCEMRYIWKLYEQRFNDSLESTKGGEFLELTRRRSVYFLAAISI